MSIYAFGFLSRQFYLILRLTKCNSKFVFFFLVCFILLFYFCTLFIKEKKGILKEKCSTFSMFGPMVFRECHDEITWEMKVWNASFGIPYVNYSHQFEIPNCRYCKCGCNLTFVTHSFN